MVLLAGLRWDQIYRKAEAVDYDFCIQGFQSCHYGLWSRVNFLRPLGVVQSRIPAALPTSKSNNS
jgi:hypothetical protein